MHEFIVNLNIVLVIMVYVLFLIYVFIHDFHSFLTYYISFRISTFFYIQYTCKNRYMIVHNGVKVCFFMFLVWVRKDRKHGVKWYAYKHKQKKPKKKSKSKNITCTQTYKLTALNLRIFQYVIIIYTNNSMNIIFRTYMYIFLFMREKKAERKKLTGQWLLCGIAVYQGLLIKKIYLDILKKHHTFF